VCFSPRRLSQLNIVLAMALLGFVFIVGPTVFIARISRGRTIREFVAGVLFAPTAFTLVWFGIFGLSAIQVEMDGQIALAEQVQQDPSVAIFAFRFIGH
jgi:choline-glycine betaine transporter